jgi:2-C-methyl-D-erythritol 4-phosphate cytidylyltransferase
VSAAPLGLIVVAAGSSTRMGEIDKVWASLAGKPLLSHSIDNLAPLCVEVVIVVRADRTQEAASWFGSRAHLRVVSGGNDRRASVSAGLQALGDVELIAVHDSARPFAAPSLLQRGLETMAKSVAAVPVIPVADTVKRLNPSGAVMETIPRDSLRLVQTPQLFQASVLREAHAEPARSSEPTTDDSTLVEALGQAVATFRGDVRNFKITTPFDLELARCILESDL